MKILKSIIILLLLITATTTFSQKRTVFHLNKLSQQDTLLSGWKMFAGDETRFANPSLDDSKWQPIDLNQDITRVSSLKKSGIIWLRLHVKVDSKLNDELLAAHIIQYTASEVYLNGKRIQQYGTVSKDPKKVVAYLPSGQPFIINLLKDTQNVIAVRVAYEPGIPYISYLNNHLPVFNLYINKHTAAAENYSYNEYQLKMYVIIYSISSGTLLIIGFIYLVYFLFDRSKKVHLYYAVSMIALSLNALPIEVWGADRYGKVMLMMWIFYFEVVAFTIGNLFMVLTIYSLFNYPRRAVIKVLIVLSATMIVAMYTYGTLVFYASTYFFPVFYLLEGTYACVWAIRNHKKDAGIILVGLLFYLIITTLSIFIPIDSISSQLLFYVAQMSFPIGMSFYLGIQSSNTNNQLRTTLAEVQSLSEKSLVQEKEKQQILFNQNELLERQVTERTAELNHSLQELKSTQSQLIQSEKMASLGELTAGIAHEIQNPLNFVNNFSEVNKEMLEELKAERLKPNAERDDDLEIDLINDVIANEEKINHHGKRADAIVKGMLQHSRQTKGVKEPTDINALCDEYLRLSYHGLRAKDKNFNTDFKTDFDKTIGKINIVPQDIGRVLLNLFNNAFYTVNEKQKLLDNSYQPIAEVKTRRINNNVEITITDNGNDIPQNIIDKIFQPFFTTKPTGQGTGLGLSLAYDIITKEHNGSIKVESKEGEGTTFTTTLPV